VRGLVGIGALPDLPSDRGEFLVGGRRLGGERAEHHELRQQVTRRRRVRLDVTERETDNGRIVVVDHVGKMRLEIGKQLVGLAKRSGSGTHGVRVYPPRLLYRQLAEPSKLKCDTPGMVASPGWP
jgi:hypothetical protein